MKAATQYHASIGWRIDRASRMTLSGEGVLEALAKAAATGVSSICGDIRETSPRKVNKYYCLIYTALRTDPWKRTWYRENSG